MVFSQHVLLIGAAQRPCGIRNSFNGSNKRRIVVHHGQCSRKARGTPLWLAAVSTTTSNDRMFDHCLMCDCVAPTLKRSLDAKGSAQSWELSKSPIFQKVSDKVQSTHVFDYKTYQYRWSTATVEANMVLACRALCLVKTLNCDCTEQR
eukprot:21040-Heterococcus_DN1.PRE.2